jgi:hypothetical protein
VANHPIQLSVEHKGKSYGGIYSVSGTLMIARIPGINSLSQEIGEDEKEPLALSLLSKILEDAEAQGELDR